MPWRETCAMTERLRFIACLEEGDETMAALCRGFGISRKTGYQLLARYEAEGEDGLRDRSHAAHHHPHAVDDVTEERIVALRSKHRSLERYAVVGGGRPPPARAPDAVAIGRGETVSRHRNGGRILGIRARAAWRL